MFLVWLPFDFLNSRSCISPFCYASSILFSVCCVLLVMLSFIFEALGEFFCIVRKVVVRFCRVEGCRVMVEWGRSVDFGKF